MNRQEQKAIIQILRKWADKKPFIQEVFIYGSQIQECVHTESDLDIGIELESQEGDESVLTTYLCEVEKWKNELQPLIKWPLHLEFHDFSGGTPRISEGKKKGCVLVYKRRRK